MKRLLLLLPLLLMLPASAQTLTKEQTANFRAQIFQHFRNTQAALDDGDFEMACASLQKQNAVLATVMTDLQFHFPETDWMAARIGTTKMLNKDYCFAGGIFTR